MEWFKRENKDVNLWELSRSSGVPKNPGSKPRGRKRSRNVLPQVKTTSDKLCKRDTTPFNPSPPQTQQHLDDGNHWYPSPYDPYYGMHYNGPSTSYYHSPMNDFCQYSPASPHQSTFFHPPPFHSQQRFQPGSTSFTPQPQNYSLPGPTMPTPYPITPSMSQPRNHSHSSSSLETVYEPLFQSILRR